MVGASGSCSSMGGGSSGSCSGGHGGDEYDNDTVSDDLPPPASALTRRVALVPPKLLTDGAPFDETEADQARPLNG